MSLASVSVVKEAPAQRLGIIKTGALGIADFSASKLCYLHTVYYYAIYFLVKLERRAAIKA